MAPSSAPINAAGTGIRTEGFADSDKRLVQHALPCPDRNVGMRIACAIPALRCGENGWEITEISSRDGR